MAKIICIGSSGQDIFFPTMEGIITVTPEDITSQKKISFELGAKYHIDDRFESLGGCAVNVACGLQRLGVPNSCYTVLGDDTTGQWVREGLKKEGVDDSLIISENCPSGLSAIIVDARTGERIIFSNQEANERMRIEEGKIEGADWISVSDPNGDWRKILSDVMDYAFKTGTRIAFNPRGRNIEEDAKKIFELTKDVEIFFVNKDEAIEIVSRIEKDSNEDLNSEKFLLKRLKKGGARVVVLTDGMSGAWAYDGKEMIHAGAVPVVAKDSTGAGDAFASGFLAAFIKEKSLEVCLKWGIANGGNVVKFYGGVEGLLKESETEEKIKNIDISYLQR